MSAHVAMNRLTFIRRHIAYHLLMSLVVVIFGGLWLFEGYYIITAWFPSLYDEITPINGAMAGAFMTVMFICAIAALIQPEARTNESGVLLIGATVLALWLPIAFILETPVLTGILLVVGLGIVVGVATFHPAGSAVRPSRRGAINTPIATLTVIGAIPMLWLIIEFQYLQITLDDEVAQRWFYGGFSMYCLTLIALSAVASVDEQLRRACGVTVCFFAGILALVSIAYPTALHSFGTVGGSILFGWTVIYGIILWRS